MDQGLSLIKTSAILAEREMIFVAKGLVEFKDNKCLVVIANLSRKHVSLPKGTILATVTTTNSEEYLHIMQFSRDKEVFKENEVAEKMDIRVPEPVLEDMGVPRKDLDLSGSKCTALEMKLLKKLISKYSKCFAKNPKSPDPALGVTHNIDTGAAKPINCAPYRVSPVQRTAIESQINDMLKNKIIEPSRSPLAAPIVLVSKTDGSIRFCLDYRKLNNVTKRDVYPLPRIDDCLNALGGSKYFSTFDLAAGYWQIPMGMEDN